MLSDSPQPIPFSEFTETVLRIYSTGRHARKTFLRVRQILRELAALGVHSTSDLTTETMARYVSSKGSASNPNTVNGLLGAIASVCSIAVEERWLRRSPAWKRLRLRPSPMTANAPRKFDELARLLGHLAEVGRVGRWEDRRLSALAWTVAMTGARRDEALRARVEDLDLGAFPSLTVSPRARLKTEASARTVPLPDALVEVLRRWVPETGSPWLFPGSRRRGPWTGGSPGFRALDAMKSAAREVGIDRITWHSLRHSFGTNAMERWGVPLWVVQRVMGHTDPRTTARYLHLDGSPAIAAAVRPIAYVALSRV